MASRWFLIVFVYVLMVPFLWVSFGESASSKCSPVEENSIKVEAWMSKQYEKSLRQIRDEFSAMGNTRVTLWGYPTKNPSKIVAIGSCVPAYIGRHMLRKAIEYSGGVSSLVHQGFFLPTG